MLRLTAKRQVLLIPVKKPTYFTHRHKQTVVKTMIWCISENYDNKRFSCCNDNRLGTSHNNENVA